MSKDSLDRRNFLKLMGLGSAAIGAGISVPKLIGKTENGYLVESTQEYGGFRVEKISNGKFPYQWNEKVLKAMGEKQTVFSRNFWDPARKNRPETREDLTTENLVNGRGKIPNQSRLDYALMAAAWSVSSGRGYPSYKWGTQTGWVKGLEQLGLDPWQPEEQNMDWQDASFAVKHAALFYGASLAGIARLNPLWLYTDCFSPTREQQDRAIPVMADGERYEQTEEACYLPKSMNRVIALAFEEDYSAIANSPGRLASAATANGYSRMAFTAFCLAEFIRGLGYRALPAGNGTGLSIPMAIDAGLGELGRNGLLITPKYGPRVRIAKVITNMPLAPDTPIRFGVTEFCKVCMRCAEDCPSGSISKGEQNWSGISPSNNPGVYKWYIEPEKCYDFNGFSCSNCKRNCPFNKPNNSWLHRFIRTLINTKIPILDRAMVTFDQASGYGKQVPDHTFWAMKGAKSITARNPE